MVTTKKKVVRKATKKLGVRNTRNTNGRLSGTKVAEHFNIDNNKISIVSLSENIDVDGFRCEVRLLDNYLRRRALLNDKAKISKTFLAMYGNVVVGYISLGCDAICTVGKEDEFKRIIGEGKYFKSYGAIKILRLATDKRYTGNHIGEAMIGTAIIKAKEVNNIAACRFLTVDALDQAVGFYKKMGFVSMDDEIHDNKTQYMRYDLFANLLR